MHHDGFILQPHPATSQMRTSLSRLTDYNDWGRCYDVAPEADSVLSFLHTGAQTGKVDEGSMEGVG